MLKKKKITARMLAVFLGLCSVIGSISTVNAAPILNVKEDKSQNSDTEKYIFEEKYLILKIIPEVIFILL